MITNYYIARDKDGFYNGEPTLKEDEGTWYSSNDCDLMCLNEISSDIFPKGDI